MNHGVGAGNQSRFPCKSKSAVKCSAVSLTPKLGSFKLGRRTNRDMRFLLRRKVGGLPGSSATLWTTKGASGRTVWKQGWESSRPQGGPRVVSVRCHSLPGKVNAFFMGTRDPPSLTFSSSWQTFPGQVWENQIKSVAECWTPLLTPRTWDVGCPQVAHGAGGQELGSLWSWR